MRTKTIRIMAALLAIVMLGGCTGTGAGGADDSNAGRSRTRAKKNSSSRHDRLIGFSYSPGYSDMMGAYYAEKIIRAEDGTYTYVVTKREYHSAPDIKTVYAFDEAGMDTLKEIIDKYDICALEKRPESDEYVLDYSPWRYSLRFDDSATGGDEYVSVSFNEYQRYRKGDEEALDELLNAARALRGEQIDTVTEGDDENTVTHYNVSIEQRYDSVERNDAGSHFYHPYDVLTGTDPFLPDAMARALNDLSSQYETESAEMCAKAEREAEENEDFSAYVKDDCTLFRADSRVLSFARKRDTHNNGSAAFANVRDKSFTTYNFDPENGKQIPLTDVVLDIDAFSKLTAGQLYERYVEGSTNPMAKDLFESKEKLADDIGQILTDNWMYADQVYTWSPTYLGVKLLFFDEIASYEGVQAFRDNGGYYILPDCFEVTVPYSMAPEIFEASYTDLPENYFAEIETETDYLLETAGGQTKLRVEAPVYQDESGVGGDTTLYTGEMHVLLGEEETVFENTEISPYMNFDTAVYLAQNEGKTFLYLGQEGEYGEWFVEVYEIKDGALQHVGHMEEGFEPDDFPPLDPACFHTRIITGILNNPFAESRVSCVRMNTLGDDGMPAPHFMAPDTPSDYRVMGLQPSYTLAVPVTAPYWDGQGVAFMESGTKTYPAGTVIRMTHTDNKSYVLLQPDGSEEYIIAYSEKSAYGPWPVVTRIGGTPLETAFVPPYAAYTEPADAAIALETDVWDGYWWNPDTGDELWMHGFRGEFELTFGTTGDYHAGTIIYNGNPEHPVYTLKDDDTGYNLADLYYLEGEYMPDDYRMMITFHFSEGDVFAVFYQPKG